MVDTLNTKQFCYYEYTSEPTGKAFISGISPQMAQALGIEPDTLRESATPLFELLSQEQCEQLNEAIETSRASLSPFHFVGCFKRQVDSVPIWLEATSSPTASSNGAVVWSGVLKDVTERELTNQSDSAALFILNNMLDAVITTDRFGTVLFTNTRVQRLLGYQQHELVGQNVKLIVSSQYRDRHDSLVANYHRTKVAGVIGKNRQLEARHKDGYLIPIELRVSELESAKDFHFLGVIRDLRPKKEKEQALQRALIHDPLTGIMNRDGFLRGLAQCLHSESAAQSASYRLLLIDIDDFTLINTGFGSAAGDIVLQAVSERLQVANLECARIQKDQFAVLLSQHAKPSDITQFHMMLKEQVEQRVSFEDHRISFRVTTAVYPFDNRDTTARDILQDAECALAQAKNRQRGGLYFHVPSQDCERKLAASVDQMLKSGGYLDDLFLLYQPQYDSNHRIIGYEALIRWSHNGDIIPPDVFIPIAEHNGAIIEIGSWLVEAACKTLQAFSNIPRLSINISPKQFSHIDFVDSILAALSRHQIESSRLRLELTERLLVESVGDVAVKIKQLNHSGITFSLDDFGTGYSSLAYLSGLPLNELKIDKSFIHGLTATSPNYQIVEAILSLSQSLRLSVIAEGVETTEEQQLLQLLGCNGFQGYLLGRPIPLNNIAALEYRTKT